MDKLCSQILLDFQEYGLITAHQGADHRITDIKPVEFGGVGDLVFVEKEKYLAEAMANKVSAIITTTELADKIDDKQIAVLTTPNVRMAMAHVRQKYVDRNLYHTEWPRVHPSSIIHNSVLVPEDAVIGPGVVIGADVLIGEKVVIMANSVIEQNVMIGTRTIIHPSCVVGYRCKIGSDVILKSGCVIGSDGQGFAQDQDRRHHRIPQTGIVVIGDKAVIGANCTIDRATYTETTVQSGTIIDAQCHLAHNVDIGEDCIIVAQSGIAGSSRLGKRVIVSGQTGVLDHISVPDDTVLLHRAGLMSSIKKPGVYAGVPSQPLKKYLKNIAIFQRLDEVWSRLKALEKSLDKLHKNQN
ncbi:MAG: UDP-3-O-(3-hydroxymyristoyl)glucosamine N-acyltransferase [Methylococcaceae bacterium]